MPPRPVITGPLWAAPDRACCRSTEGISVGYGDVYGAYLEYQDLPLDGLPAGRYVLVHSSQRRRPAAPRDQSRANDSASVLLDLRWHAGAPKDRTVTQLRSCPDSADCAHVPKRRAHAALAHATRDYVPERPGHDLARRRLVGTAVELRRARSAWTPPSAWQQRRSTPGAPGGAGR
jgi:hypothetical protein